MMNTYVFAPQGSLGTAIFNRKLPASTATPIVITSVVVAPASVSLSDGITFDFDAVVNGSGPFDPGVTWETTLGQIDAGGVVTPPPAGLVDLLGTVTATSTQDPTVKGTATFTLLASVPVDPPQGDAAPRFARPFRDIDKGAWQASSGSDLFDMLNETEPDMGDFITATTASTCELGLGPVADPGTNTNQVIRYEAHAPEGGTLTVQLKQGNTVIASWHHDTLPTKATVHEQALTSAQCDSITNYRDLRIQLVAA